MFHNLSREDILLFYDNVLRAVLILICLKKITHIKYHKNIFQIFFLIFLLMEFIYAQATVNWGTASRHHMPVLGILILISFLKTNNSKRR